MKKCIITVVGKDSVGIIAKVCTYLAIIPTVSFPSTVTIHFFILSVPPL